MLTLEQARYFARKVVSDAGPEFRYCDSDTVVCQYIAFSEIREKWDPVAQRNFGLGPYQAGDPREHTGCLVGRILDEAGETRHHLAKFEGQNVMDMYYSQLDMMTLEAAHYLSSLQVPQDQGETWGVALATAEAVLAGARVNAA